MVESTATDQNSTGQHLHKNGFPETCLLPNHPCKQTEFDKLFLYNKPPKPELLKQIEGCLHFHPVKVILGLFPILSWLPNYGWKTDLLSDAVSGFTVAVMHIPQGMAYAMLAAVPPVVGIYMAFFPVLIYVIMGTSKHVSMGTFAVVCMMTSKSVLKYSSHNIGGKVEANASNSTSSEVYNIDSDLYSPIQVATAVCFAVGVWQIVLGILRLGVLSVLLSDTLVSGFTTGAAVHVLSSQLKNLFGINPPRQEGALKVVNTFIGIFFNINQTNFMALGISAVTIIVLTIYNELIKPQISKKLPVPIPIELITVIIGTVSSMYLHLPLYKIDVIGDVPKGFPIPEPPPFSLIPNVLVDGLVIAVVAFSINMSMASIFARKLNYSIDANQELLASGVSNVFGSFFSCVPFSASLSRSLIQQSVGGKTQLASVVSCLLLCLVLLVVGPFFEPLPNCILSSIIVVALKGMFMQFKEVPKIWHESRKDGFIWILTFLSVCVLDIDYGLFIGILASLICVVVMGQRLKVYLLGHVPTTHIYLDMQRYQAAEPIPGIQIVHVAGGLHFANKDHVKQKIYKLLGELPHPKIEEKTMKVSCVILDMMAVSFIDPSSVKMLLAMYADLESKAIMFCLADCSALVYERLVHCDFFYVYPENQVFPTIHDAVLHARLTINNE